ncbi:MerC domain-containing protein [Ferruginibacter albus]|uniref:MerC domain-containing protein n=1 Tax=Ferruginibacter albus TaxID=2875540 RepID=UPI001CC4D319|nr:MerC domain-containing protein [Ferruginibacter albus]UAY51951.1 MerC domain-containing protein [Ferruginibacter albus]
MDNNGLKVNWDVMGITASVLCAIHCALLPVIVTTLPVFGINIIHNTRFEWGMIALAFFVGSFALIHGYIKHHRSLMPVWVFTFGFVFLLLKQFFHAFEYWFLAPAVILVVSAHFYNFRLCRQTKCESSHHKH